ncbi:MAG: D-alanyl-D-alanine carboxypeptidase/D-alanyl-D-alanine-endopeptidase [Silvanigrellales bacterium]|nr:D-alanyl-D-alanine carboxypeptidase/D-alanyl-D-alanine-endopeptidase [Silvanigrellales bacterium]
MPRAAATPLPATRVSLVAFSFCVGIAGWGRGALSAEARAQADLLPNLQALEREGARVSALAVNLRTGETLVERKSGDRLTPASVSKLVLASAVLETFGSEHTFKTRFFRRGALKGNTLNGDLVFVGAGDPSLTNEKLWFLATDVARMGIREVTGDLVLNTSAFGPIVKDSNRRAGARASTHAYDSPLSAAAVNFSVLAVVAGPGAAVGAPAQVALEPYDLDSVRLSGKVATGTATKVSASRVDKGAFDIVVASGTVASGGFPARVYRSVSDADAYAASTLRAFLANAGVKVRGKSRIETTPPSSKAMTPVAEVEGFPLDWQIRGLFKVSNNFIGDMLTIQLDGQGRESGATFARGAEALERYAKETLASSRFRGSTTPSGLVLESGSGLTPENRMAARDVVAVLDRMHGNPREFPSFLSALPIPGSEGTVRRRFRGPGAAHLKDTIRAKTGTLTEPIDAVGLAGYSRTKVGDWVAFCFLVNGTSGKPNFGVERVRDAIDADLAVLLPPEN